MSVQDKYKAAYLAYCVAVKNERETSVAWQLAQKAKQKAEEELVRARRDVETEFWLEANPESPPSK